MIRVLREPVRIRQIGTWLIAAAVLTLAFLLGWRASTLWLGLLAAGISCVVLLARPVLGLPALVLASLVVPLEIGTGTDVKLNPATLLVPALLAAWLLVLFRQRRVQIAASLVNRPLALFLTAGLLSLLIGRATWDSAVPVGSNFLLVQLAQWAIFGFSAGAFWLTANLIKDERSLWRLTAFFLLVGGGLAILRSLPGTGAIEHRFTTSAFTRAPFWILVSAAAGGQLVFNRSLSTPWRVFLVGVLGVCLHFALVQARQVASQWVGIGAVLGTLFWLRFPRLRWPVAILLIGLILSGVLAPMIYEFAGGDQEWGESGGSRLALIGRVIELTTRNPITGLGPAAYRPYGLMGSLQYGRAFYESIALSSHNNYVDLFSHGGVLGLGLFLWFAWEVARLGLSLRKRYAANFAAGYVNGMLAAGAGALVIMALADWVLPFVYNIGFPGFQASVLVWLFLGGLVALDNMPRREPGVASQPVVTSERSALMCKL